MGFEYVSKLPTPDEIRAQFPLAPELAAEKARKDAAIRDVFTGDSDKFLVIIGPCSADREDAVIDYVNRLAKVQEKVKDKLILVPRIYTNKPRTTGDGYKGLLHQPNPEGKPNLYQGLIAIRKLHMRVIEETGFSTADEMLYPENLTYLSDVMSMLPVARVPLRTSSTGLRCQRHRRTGRHEKSDQRRTLRHAERRTRSTARS